jgi:hypothetical protein
MLLLRFIVHVDFAFLSQVDGIVLFFISCQIPHIITVLGARRIKQG